MKILLTILFIGLSINIYACDHTNITIKVDGERKKIEFNHKVYRTNADKNGYFDCNHFYVIDPVSKLGILHNPNFMMNDFIMDSVHLPKHNNKDIYKESNLSFCSSYKKNMSIFSTKEKIEYINQNIVSLESNSYFYGAGAAHGHTKLYHFIYNRNNGMKISWDDLFKDKSIEKYILTRVVNELASESYMEFVKKDDSKFIQIFHSIDPDSVLMNFKNSGRFTIVDEGLKIQYNAYEIAPYCNGSPSLIVSKKVLKDYMDEEVYEMCFSS